MCEELATIDGLAPQTQDQRPAVEEALAVLDEFNQSAQSSHRCENIR